MAQEGRAPDGIPLIDKSMKIFADMNFRYFRSVHLGMKARAYEAARDFEKALAILAEGIAFAHESDEKVLLSDLVRASGDLHLILAGPQATDLAENLFVEAIALAKAQASKLHELRAATGLARLWQGQGKHAVAGDVLAPVYAWFKDGFDSPDLRQAKSILDAQPNNLRHVYA
ncbi:MAG: hypothetical protein JOZ16_01900 [Methylobacteriaceae bacterium]|nr:hypothetical protein [Methylobacteriaceae bacterium]